MIVTRRHINAIPSLWWCDQCEEREEKCAHSRYFCDAWPKDFYPGTNRASPLVL